MDLDARRQAELLRRGELDPSDLLHAAVSRIERWNPAINAIVIPLFERAAAAVGSLAKGPLRGVPLLVKDALCHTAGDPYHFGMRFLKELGWIERHDTYLAQRFREAGLLLLGKTNTPELAASATTEPEAYGPTRNPWALDRSPGGSSGGSAAAVAAGMAAIAHGNDMVGSIRIPASCCGVVGLKPTRARTTLGPDFGEYCWQLTHHGVLTRTVLDTAAVLDAIGGPAPGDPYVAPPLARPLVDAARGGSGPLRIGLRWGLPQGEEAVHPDCEQAVTAVGRLLEGRGHRVVPVAPGPFDTERISGDLMRVLWASLARELDRWAQRTERTIGRDDVEEATWVQAQAGRRITATELLGSVEALQRFSRDVADWWRDQQLDLLVSPTLPDPPAVLGRQHPRREAGLPRPILFTAPFNVTGQPAVSLPLHHGEGGLPIGVQIVAGYGREDLLVEVGADLEAEVRWADRRPPEPPRVSGVSDTAAHVPGPA